MTDKLKLGVYWGASCGGCDVALLDIHEKILELIQVADIVFWPCAMDFKYHDVEAMPDAHLDLLLWSGAIRNTENEQLAQLLRRKSKTLLAFGSCAHTGGIPGLSNFHDREQIFETVYGASNGSTENEQQIRPRTELQVPEGTLELPRLFDTVRTLAQTVEVDYFVPGCPPDPTQIVTLIDAAAAGTLPPRGAVVGAAEVALCDECPRQKGELSFSGFVRRHLVRPDPERCLLEQGMICLGSATRAGCGWRCIHSNMPCRGCYGPLPGVPDQGAKMLSALASHVHSDDADQIEQVLGSLPDPAGYFYRFGLPHSLLRRRLQQAAATDEELAQ